MNCAVEGFEMAGFGLDLFCVRNDFRFAKVPKESSPIFGVILF